MKVFSRCLRIPAQMRPQGADIRIRTNTDRNPGGRDFGGWRPMDEPGKAAAFPKQC